MKDQIPYADNLGSMMAELIRDGKYKEGKKSSACTDCAAVSDD